MGGVTASKVNSAAAVDALGRAAVVKATDSASLAAPSASCRLVIPDCSLGGGREAWHTVSPRDRGGGPLRNTARSIALTDCMWSAGRRQIVSTSRCVLTDTDPTTRAHFLCKHVTTSRCDTTKCWQSDSRNADQRFRTASMVLQPYSRSNHRRLRAWHLASRHHDQRPLSSQACNSTKRHLRIASCTPWQPDPACCRTPGS